MSKSKHTPMIVPGSVAKSQATLEAAKARGLEVERVKLRAELLFKADGTALFMHEDKLMPLAKAIGQVTVRRASSIEWTDGAWGVWTQDGTDTGQRFETREEALAWEREHFWGMVGE